jgi:hypothetical protein
MGYLTKAPTPGVNVEVEKKGGMDANGAENIRRIKLGKYECMKFLVR